MIQVVFTSLIWPLDTHGVHLLGTLAVHPLDAHAVQSLDTHPSLYSTKSWPQHLDTHALNLVLMMSPDRRRPESDAVLRCQGPAGRQRCTHMEDDFGVAPPLAPGPATRAEYCDWPFDICDWSLDISKRATG